MRFTNSLGQDMENEFLSNSMADPNAAYGPEQSAVLNDAAFAQAHATVTAWPGYARTPLVSLPALAAEAGIASLHYKDEGTRFGLGSFKALGGAYAVSQLLRRQVAGANNNELPEITAILDGSQNPAMAFMTGKLKVEGSSMRALKVSDILTS